MRRLGKEQAHIVRYVEQHPGCTMGEIEDATAPLRKRTSMMIGGGWY